MPLTFRVNVCGGSDDGHTALVEKLLGRHGVFTWSKCGAKLRLFPFPTN